MGLYDGIKDLAKVVQQADNIDLYRQLLDLGAQALEMQDELRKLKEENSDLKHKVKEHQRINRHKGAFITIEGDNLNIPYCAICYAKTGSLLQLRDFDALRYGCYNCGARINKDW